MVHGPRSEARGPRVNLLGATQCAHLAPESPRGRLPGRDRRSQALSSAGHPGQNAGEDHVRTGPTTLQCLRDATEEEAELEELVQLAAGDSHMLALASTVGGAGELTIC